MKFLARLSLIFILFLTLFGCKTNHETFDTNERFEELLNLQLIESMGDDIASIDMMFENPSDYGIDVDSDVKARLISEEAFDYNRDDFKEDNKYLYELLKLNYNDLSFDQKKIYDGIKMYLDINYNKLNDKYDYYEQIFTNNNNPALTITQYLFDYNIDNEEAIKILIDLFEDIPNYIDKCIKYAYKQAELGYFIADDEFLLAYIDDLLTNDISVLLEGNFKAIDELELDNKEEYKNRLYTLANDNYINGLKDIKEMIEDLDSKDKINEESIASLPYGSEYYELELKELIMSDISIDEYVEYILNKMNDVIVRYFEIVENNPQVEEKLYGNDSLINKDLESFDAVIKMIDGLMDEDFPRFKEFKYEIKNINQAILGEDSTTLAYYWTSAYDNSGLEKMRVNPKYSDLNNLDTYTTIAHEGLPGHMYQFNYIKENTNPFVYTLGNFNLSMSEGYARYVEYFSTKYVSDDSLLLEAYFLNNLYNDLLITIMDVGVNYSNWSKEEINEFYYELFGSYQEDEVIDAVYELKNTPNLLTPYVYGLSKIVDFRHYAIDELGDKFTNIGFHEALLNAYNMPFNVLERSIDKYIEDNK